MLLARIKLEPFMPFSNGNERLLQIRAAGVTRAAAVRFAAERKSPQLDRFIKLSEGAAAAMQDAFDRDAVLKWGPHTFYRGVEGDLAEICIGRGP